MRDTGWMDLTWRRHLTDALLAGPAPLVALHSGRIYAYNSKHGSPSLFKCHRSLSTIDHCPPSAPATPLPPQSSGASPRPSRHIMSCSRGGSDRYRYPDCREAAGTSDGTACALASAGCSHRWLAASPKLNACKAHSPCPPAAPQAHQALHGRGCPVRLPLQPRVRQPLGRHACAHK